MKPFHYVVARVDQSEHSGFYAGNANPNSLTGDLRLAITSGPQEATRFHSARGAQYFADLLGKDYIVRMMPGTP